MTENAQTQDRFPIHVVPDPLTPDTRETAREIAGSRGWSFSESFPETGFVLRITPERVELLDAGHPRTGAVAVDFLGGKAAYRRLRGGGTSRKQPLARAVGFPSSTPPFVIDATAGLGRDAFVLASIGCRVLAIERSPVIALLLRDGLDRARRSGAVDEIIGRLDMREGDATEYLRGLSERTEAVRPDIVYMDPMYPPRSGKSAAVKKEMQMLRKLIGPDLDSSVLFDAARAVATKRVVVKRPRHAPPLVDAPTASFQMKKTRFDVYLRNQNGKLPAPSERLSPSG